MWQHGDNLYPFEDPHRANLAKGPSGTVLKALRHVTDWTLALDGGAHVGVVSRHLAEHFENVIAVELAPDTTECLKQNLEGLGVRIINAALGDRPGRVGYEGDRSDKSSVRCVVPGDDVEVITIDSLELPSCGFIKLDLQGYDYLALLGAEQTLKAYHPVIIFEHKSKCFSRYGTDPDAPKSFLQSCGYVTFKRSSPDVICYGEM